MSKRDKVLWIVGTLVLLVGVGWRPVQILRNPRVEGGMMIGTGTPAITVEDGDLWIADAVEIDGAARFDSTLDINGEVDLVGPVSVGAGSPGISVGADDLYVTGTAEVDGELQADGIFDANSTSDFADTATFSKGSGNAVVISAGGTLSLPATADISALGYVNIGNGTPDGAKIIDLVYLA
jgi:hypothetical protein